MMAAFLVTFFQVKKVTALQIRNKGKIIVKHIKTYYQLNLSLYLITISY